MTWRVRRVSCCPGEPVTMWGRGGPWSSMTFGSIALTQSDGLSFKACPPNIHCRCWPPSHVLSLCSLFPSSLAARGSQVMPFWPVRPKQRSSVGDEPRNIFISEKKRNRRCWHHQTLTCYPRTQIWRLELQQSSWGHKATGWSVKDVGMGRQKRRVLEQLSQLWTACSVRHTNPICSSHHWQVLWGSHMHS